MSLYACKLGYVSRFWDKRNSLRFTENKSDRRPKEQITRRTGRRITGLTDGQGILESVEAVLLLKEYFILKNK